MFAMYFHSLKFSSRLLCSSFYMHRIFVEDCNYNASGVAVCKDARMKSFVIKIVLRNFL